MTEKHQIADIGVGERHRRDLGDVEALAHSIATVRSSASDFHHDEQAAYGRSARSPALQRLGRDEVPVRIVVDIGFNAPATSRVVSLLEVGNSREFDHLESTAARAAAAVTANPEKSNQAIAAETGLSEPTSRGRGLELRHMTRSTPGAVRRFAVARTGLNGRTRPLARTRTTSREQLPLSVEVRICLDPAQSFANSRTPSSSAMTARIRLPKPAHLRNLRLRVTNSLHLRISKAVPK